jgi:hypothetical protein
VVLPRRLVTRSASNAAPIAPGLAAVRVEVDLGVGHALLDVVDLGLERGEVLLGAALEHEHPAELAMRGIWTTYCQTFLGSTSARPASSSSRE